MTIWPRLSREPLSESRAFAIEYEPASAEVVMLDQRRLPSEMVYHRFRRPAEVADAIRAMVIRGAPAIGIAAAYALVLAAKDERGDASAFLAVHESAGRLLASTRPTAINLAWAIARMSRIATGAAQLAADDRYDAMRAEAEAIHREDVAACKSMGAAGAAEVPHGATILTHCNAGALATGGYGTALGVVRAAHAQGKDIRVLASETRPFFQGARLTAWELHEDAIPVEVITDSMVGHFLKRGDVQFVVVGSDRIARNGDVANKIGTYGLAVLARAHGVPFTVAAPWSTVDLSVASGTEIPIEERPRVEMAWVGQTQLVADGIGCRHPAFDVTPAQWVDSLYTERGTLHPARGEMPELLHDQDSYLGG